MRLLLFLLVLPGLAQLPLPNLSPNYKVTEDGAVNPSWYDPSLSVLALAAQTPPTATLTINGPQNVRPGKTITLNLTLATTTQPSGLQWTAGIPQGWTAKAMPGAVATAAQKAIYCSEGDALCLVVGLNQTPIAAGVVATFEIGVPAGTPRGLSSIPLTGLVAGTGMGDPIPVSAGTAYSIRVLAKHDLNGDGTTNAADLQLMADQIVGKSACADDQNGDGACDLIDALLVILGSIAQ